MTTSNGSSGTAGRPGKAHRIVSRARALAAGAAAAVTAAVALAPAAGASLAAEPAMALVPPAIDPPAEPDTLLTMLIHPATTEQQVLVGLGLAAVAAVMIALSLWSLRGLKAAVTKPAAPARSRPRKR